MNGIQYLYSKSWVLSRINDCIKANDIDGKLHWENKLKRCWLD
jgi:hypothetical protein